MQGIIDFMIAWKEVIALVLFVIMFVNAEAKAAVATVNEIMQKSQMSDELALELGAKLLGKIAFLKWMPMGIRKFLVQMAFNSIKKLANKSA